MAKATVKDVLYALQFGHERLIKTIIPGGGKSPCEYSLSGSGLRVEPKVATVILSDAHVAPVGDGLFPGEKPNLRVEGGRMTISLAEILKFDKDLDWLADQPRDDLARLVDRLIDMELAVDPQEFEDLQDELDRESDVGDEGREALEMVRDYIRAGRLDDALLLIERTLYPRRSLPMRAEKAAA